MVYWIIMQKRSSKSNSNDMYKIAFRVMAEAAGQDQAAKDEGKNFVAVALGRLGGRVGGKARAEKLIPARREDIPRIAASARWKKTDYE